jgi:hypoxanthine phosphoribosyltransferase
MTSKHFYSWQDIDNATNKFVTDMYIDMWKPDYIIGLTRGGLPLAVALSNKIDVPMKTLDVSFRDGTSEGPESNLQMAQDAFGQFQQGVGYEGKNILIIDDINDTGATFQWIKDDWMKLHNDKNGMLGDESSWDSVWGENVRFAVLTENLSSEFSGVDYWAHEVNKAEEDVWLVYPWEM